MKIKIQIIYRWVYRTITIILTIISSIIGAKKWMRSLNEEMFIEFYLNLKVILSKG